MWPKMYDNVSASKRILRALSTAPVIKTPKCASNNAGIFGAITDTVSPIPTPFLLSAEASLRQRL